MKIIAQTKYNTIRKIIICNPHITPSSVGANASIRLGRSGGVQSGTWWEVANNTNSKFYITREADVKTGVEKIANALWIKALNESSNSILYLGTQFVSGSAFKVSIIAQGVGHYSTSKMHFCLNNNSDNDATYTANNIGTDARMTIQKNGNVGVTNTDQNLASLCIGSCAAVSYSSYNAYSAPTSLAIYADDNVGAKNGALVIIWDQSLKTNISTIDNALQKVEQLRGDYFTFN